MFFERLNQETQVPRTPPLIIKKLKSLLVGGSPLIM